MGSKSKKFTEQPQTAEREDHRLEKGVLFRLIQSVNLIAKPFVDHHAKRFNLTLTEWRTMMMLATRPGLCGEDIAHILSMERMTVSRVLRRMQGAGLTERRKSVVDRKRSCWFLTANGWAIFDEIVPHALDRQEHVLSGLNKSQRKALSEAIDSIIEQARDSKWPEG